MHEHKYEYGPISRGIYMALIWVSLAIGMGWPKMLPYYLGFLLFLGLGLRPLLEKTGLADLFMHLVASTDEKLHKGSQAKLSRKIDRKVRDEKYRKSRYRDPRLPKDW